MWVVGKGWCGWGAGGGWARWAVGVEVLVCMAGWWWMEWVERDMWSEWERWEEEEG